MIFHLDCFAIFRMENEIRRCAEPFIARVDQRVVRWIDGVFPHARTAARIPPLALFVPRRSGNRFLKIMPTIRIRVALEWRESHVNFPSLTRRLVAVAKESRPGGRGEAHTANL